MTAQFDPKLISRIDRANTLLGSKHFCGIAHNGSRSALSILSDTFLVVTMPMQLSPCIVKPAWVNESVNDVELERLVA